MRTIKSFFAAALVALAAAPAGASFHLFQMDELYSNADGTVQFLELRALSGGQQFVTGHTLRATQGTTVHVFTVPSDLPGDTGGKRFLIATQGFAALGIVTPDYVVPNNFFPMGNGTLSWGEGSDVWNYAGLPSDGNLSLQRSGGAATNSPQNFGGSGGRVMPGMTAPPPSHDNYQALWWHSPANSESGWGVNITHQGDILFATWFTYDTDGSPMWLVMSNGNRIANGSSYAGLLYRTTGPAFSSATWDSSAVGVTQVGSLQFDFSDANNAVMSYSVNGVNQSKAITRQIYSTPVPACASGGAPGSTPNYQDLWWKSPANSESGWGVNITHQGDILFATWFTYAPGAKGMWYVMSNGNKTGTATYSGALYRTTGPAFNSATWDSNAITVTQVGTATFAFTDASNGTFSYTVDGVSQSKPITRQVYSTATFCN